MTTSLPRLVAPLTPAVLPGADEGSGPCAGGSGDDEAAVASLHASLAPEDGQSKSVLIVGASPSALLMMSRIGTKFGCRVWAAPDGPTALAALADSRIDLVLIDFRMGRSACDEVARAIKGDARWDQTPVLLVTAPEHDRDGAGGIVELPLEPPLQAAEFVGKGPPSSLPGSGSHGGVARHPDASLGQTGDRLRRLKPLAFRSDHFRHLSGLALVMVAATLWATVGVASRLVPGELTVSDDVFGLARTVVAGPAILLFAALVSGPASLRPRRGSLRGFLTFGICCAVFQVCLFRSFTLLGVTVTVFLTVCLPPVLAVAWSLLCKGERISPRVLAALAMAAVGVIAFGGNDLNGGDVPQLVIGLGLSLLASVAFVVMSHAVRSLSPGQSPLLISGLGLVMAGVLLAPGTIVLGSGDWTRLQSAVTDWRSLGLLLYLGLGGTALAYLAYCCGIARCRSAVVGLVASMIEPGVAVGLSFLILGERLGTWGVLGCVLLLAALVTLWLDENASTSSSPALSPAGSAAP